MVRIVGVLNSREKLDVERIGEMGSRITGNNFDSLLKNALL